MSTSRQANARGTCATAPAQKPLAAGIAILLLLAAPEAMATSWIVNNCNESGFGSLREVVGRGTTLSGDTVDLTALNCPNSTISLETGGTVTVNQDTLTLQGPGANYLAIDGSGDPFDNLINHTGAGILTVKGLTLQHGYGHRQYPPTPPTARGGCLSSAGGVVLSNAVVTHCSIQYNGYAFGGGVYTHGNLTIVNSTISNSRARGEFGMHDGRGGGAFVNKNLVAKYSTIDNNYITGNGSFTHGGGLAVYGNVDVVQSTISRNYSNSVGGGLWVPTTPDVVGQTTISNSTISGNRAPSGGGLYSGQNTSISNSTIAFNKKLAVSGYSAGVIFHPVLNAAIKVTLQSALIADNGYTIGTVSGDDDLGAPNEYNEHVRFYGANNLIRAPETTLPDLLPADTITGVCPLLGPLKNNGGATQTHALHGHSPAIDAGNNSVTSPTDQRGTGFVRVSGTQADIGAFEVQQTDSIFDSDFEGCP